MTTEQTILLVEDNDDDAELTLMAFKSERLANSVVRVCDGIEALDYLFGRNSYEGKNINNMPAVVLLDLNLPRLNGHEVLKSIRAHEVTRYLPVVILTSSDDETDRMKAYSQFANSYVRKPVDYDQFTAAAKELGLYWLVLNRPLTGGK